MDTDLPNNVNYWITSTSKHDCFFKVGTEEGPIERIGAIKILLMGHSEVFQKMLGLDESRLAETGDITICDTDPETFKDFLKCVYGGTENILLKLTFEKYLKLLYLCDKYLVLEIKERLSKALLELYRPFSFQNVLQILLNPASLNNEDLEKAVSKSVQANTEMFLKDELFYSLDCNALIFIVKQENISCKEVILWQALLKWAKHKMNEDSTIKDLRSCLGEALKYIRFCTMDIQDFYSHVVPSNVLTPEEVVEILKLLKRLKLLKLKFMDTKIVCDLKYVSISTVNRFKKHVSTEFIFSAVFNNVKEISGFVLSSKVTFGEFKWNLEFQKLNKTVVGCYLHCTPVIIKSDWKCGNASVKLTLLNHFKKHNHNRFFIQCFDEGSKAWGFSQFISQDELFNVQNGFLRNGNIEVVAEVEFPVE